MVSIVPQAVGGQRSGDVGNVRFRSGRPPECYRESIGSRAEQVEVRAIDVRYGNVAPSGADCLTHARHACERSGDGGRVASAFGHQIHVAGQLDAPAQ